MNVLSSRPLFSYILVAGRHIVLRNGVKTSSALVTSNEHEGHEKVGPEDSLPPETDAQFSEDDGEHYVRQQILDASLPYVHTHGWSHEAIIQGAEQLGYSGMAHGMFPRGGVELVNHFYQQCNARLEEALKDRVKQVTDNPELKKGTTAFISEAVEERLRMNIEYMVSWHKALALHASPTNTLQALDNIGNLVDVIWYYAGDRSHDFNWYTKRGLLAVVYKTSELYMLQDKSEDFQGTWDFVNRRLSDVHATGKCVREMNGVLKNLSGFAKAGILTGLNILGLNSKTR